MILKEPLHEQAKVKVNFREHLAKRNRKKRWLEAILLIWCPKLSLHHQILEHHASWKPWSTYILQKLTVEAISQWRWVRPRQQNTLNQMWRRQRCTAGVRIGTVSLEWWQTPIRVWLVTDRIRHPFPTWYGDPTMLLHQFYHPLANLIPSRSLICKAKLLLTSAAEKASPYSWLKRRLCLHLIKQLILRATSPFKASSPAASTPPASVGILFSPAQRRILKGSEKTASRLQPKLLCQSPCPKGSLNSRLELITRYSCHRRQVLSTSAAALYPKARSVMRY